VIVLLHEEDCTTPSTSGWDRVLSQDVFLDDEDAGSLNAAYELKKLTCLELL